MINIWFSIELYGNLNYINDLKSVDLIQKTVWINYNILFWILVLNSIYILILTINRYFISKKRFNQRLY